MRKVPILTMPESFHVERVLYSNPDTFVLFEDGTWQSARCAKGDVFDERTGLLICIAKKAYGNDNARMIADVFGNSESNVEKRRSLLGCYQSPSVKIKRCYDKAAFESLEKAYLKLLRNNSRKSK